MALEQQFDVDLQLTLSTLAAGAMIRVSSNIDVSRLNGFRLVKTILHVTMTGKTTAEGPIIFGVMCNFPSATAANAALDADPQSRVADNERGDGTYIQVLDAIGLVPTVFPASDEGTGKTYEIMYGKNGWSIPEGQSLDYWARNNDGSALSAGTILQFSATHFGVWLND